MIDHESHGAPFRKATAPHASRISPQSRRRQSLIIVFAIILLIVANVTHGQMPRRYSAGGQIGIQFDGQSVVPAVVPATSSKSTSTTPVAEHSRPPTRDAVSQRLRGDARPSYVELIASLSNFDADADPDGWRVEIVLRDAMDRPVCVRANASFELMPRVPTADHRSYVDADMPPIRWSMPLQWDDDSISRVRLPLRQSLKPVLGWPSSLYRPKGSRNRGYGRHVRAIAGNRSFVTNDVRNLISSPLSGELRVRVSVPTHGVFEAAVPVRIRPAVLVDTKWPYR